MSNTVDPAPDGPRTPREGEYECSGLDAAAVARRSVEPSNLSLLGLVRHLAEVERNWFRRVMAGQDVPRSTAPTPPATATSMTRYARHNGHADFLRERIDGRVGQ